MLGMDMGAASLGIAKFNPATAGNLAEAGRVVQACGRPSWFPCPDEARMASSATYDAPGRNSAHNSA